MQRQDFSFKVVSTFWLTICESLKLNDKVTDEELDTQYILYLQHKNQTGAHNSVKNGTW